MDRGMGHGIGGSCEWGWGGWLEKELDPLDDDEAETIVSAPYYVTAHTNSWPDQNHNKGEHWLHNQIENVRAKRTGRNQVNLCAIVS